MMSRPPQPTLTKTGKRRRYPDDFRAAALLMLEGAGYPETKGALTKVSSHLKVPTATLSRWATAARNPAPSEVVEVKRLDLQQMVNTELAAIFEEMGQARQDADYRALSTAAGILIDKLQLLTGGATENVNQRVLIAYHDDDGPA